jgi:hypothetical protein
VINIFIVVIVRPYNYAFNMGKLKNSRGFAFLEAFPLIVFIVLIILAAYFIFIHSSSASSTANTSGNSTSRTTSNNPYAVLAPATEPSKTAECSEPIVYGTNGSPSPLQCPNGQLNATAWNALSALEPSVMSLGYSATESQVQAAICSDANAADEDSSASTSSAIEASIYQISKLYYAWSFSGDPSAVLANGSC